MLLFGKVKRRGGRLVKKANLVIVVLNLIDVLLVFRVAVSRSRNGRIKVVRMRGGLGMWFHLEMRQDC